MMLHLFQGDQKQIIINSFDINKKSPCNMCKSRVCFFPSFLFEKCVMRKFYSYFIDI